MQALRVVRGDATSTQLPKLGGAARFARYTLGGTTQTEALQRRLEALMGMRVQEGDRSGEQGKKVSQLNDAVSDLLQVILAPGDAKQTPKSAHTYKYCLCRGTVIGKRRGAPFRATCLQARANT